MKSSQEIEDVANELEKNGFVVIENFLNEDEIAKLKHAGLNLVDEALREKNRSFFETGDNVVQASDRYFIESADKVSYFYETSAFKENGQFNVPPEHSLNKVGHALHRLNPAFKEITFHPKIKNLCRQIGLKKPLIVQSMYIYKNPSIGGEVSAHQDASYLYTEPPALYGFWIPLDDATEENGCLWFIPGSHTGDVSFRFVRNPNKNSNKLCTTIGSCQYDEEKFEIMPTKKGSCVIIHGNVVHRSLRNHSSKSRHAYTFHVYDSAIGEYSKENWLQTDFVPLYDD